MRRISIVVKTGSKVEQIKQIDLPAQAGDYYEVCVKARPVEGQANQAVVRLLSEFLKIPKSAIRIKSGLKSKNKIVDI